MSVGIVCHDAFVLSGGNDYTRTRQIIQGSSMSVFGIFEAWRQRPVPDQADVRQRRRGCRAWPIDRGGALYAEPMVNLASCGIAGENYYWSARNPPYWQRIEGSIPELWLRSSVARKLEEVNAKLAGAGLELFVFDAWRPRTVQAYFHDIWMPQQLKTHRPELSGDALTAEIERYWAAPTKDENSPAPHATGAAVDLSLRWSGGELLWMGSLFDDVTEIAHRDYFERIAPTMCFSDAEARANRRLLHWAMDEQGFSGHAEEWWHFSWGDQMWAAVTGKKAAYYGPAEPSASSE
jgi:D-alanyl-D-alanine dipeptidase